ncbi:cell division protein SepF [Clostridium fallax]|uniref:Cell division protein SepF n=1 Tax=Clostridium fallax TaxID=1533 RepID=A0A1M4YIQ0_9CLOT|nr:cell division protein SepF [Clostridium fallax]SHF05647.1 cell division inhibitor SepF [Clostridium fallax]SQB06309.1 cell division protein SepF [Clostridium fallax]
MAKMFSKVKEILGFEDYNDEYDELDELDEEEEDEELIEPVLPKKNNQSGKVVNIHTAVSAKVMIIKPTSFEEAPNICDALKNRKIVVVNTTGLETKIAQRLLDFMSGSCYALTGELQEIERGVYILSPSNVEVSNELKSELSTKGIFNWTK